MKKALSSILLASTLGLFGCSESIYKGIILEKYYSVDKIVRSYDPISSTEIVKIKNPAYILKIDTNKGTYIMSIIAAGNVSINNLIDSLNVNDSVQFKINDKLFHKDHLNYINNENVGILQSTNIQLLSKYK